MDLKRKSNSVDYVKSLLFTKKEIGILKLIEMLPYISSTNNNHELRAVYLKIFPVFFSYAEISKTYVQECMNLIARIKRHPFFVREKKLFNGWQARLKLLLPSCEDSKELKDVENVFINIPGTDRNDIIGYSELNLFFRYHKWLKYHKLHKYLYFFANLSSAEIHSINANNILEFENKVGLYPMTTGARNAILRKLNELNKRADRLETFSKIEYYQSTSKIEKSIGEIKTILKTPIRRSCVYCKENLPVLLRSAITTVIYMVLRLPKDDFMAVHETAVSLLKMAWGCNFFGTEDKNKFNSLQDDLNSKLQNFPIKKRMVRDFNNNHIFVTNQDDINNNRIFITNNDEKFTLHVIDFDIETGIQKITNYLENVLLLEN